jgi:anti-sigma regulatory factor (Ser/Thr protein kinase)
MSEMLDSSPGAGRSVRAPAARTAPRGPSTWTIGVRRVFPGHAAQLRQVRRWLSGLLPDVPARDDVILVAVELATNAVKHTASGRGGSFAVAITWLAESAGVRIAVADDGTATGPQAARGPDLLSEHGRGLAVVRGLATRSGARGDHRGGLTWAEVPWTRPDHLLRA